MSNRSLIEINHDYTHEIQDHPEEFVKALVQYLRSGVVEERVNGHKQIFRGVAVFGMRHHSDPYEINWGGHKASYVVAPYKPKRGM